jgi:D-alanyl-D-alanine carboxypeptidase/D-alanyl-D-alanine-endopeptidase (penicillin-binding protein 4)
MNRVRGAAVRTAWGAALIVTTALSAEADPSKSRLRKTLDRIVERPALAHAFWGIEVRSLSTGKTLYERNADKGFRPASTLKLVTTAAVLDAFGPEARLRTTLETAGRLDGLGRILGDVFLVGRGDPSLSGRFDEGPPTAAFEALADGLVAVGVRRIEGRLVGHEGAFAGERRGADREWEDLLWGYGAEVSALSFNDNVVHVTLGAGERPGEPAVLEVVPRTELVLSGTLPLGGEWEGDVAVEDPALFAATVFRDVLEAKGIPVRGRTVTASEPLPAEARVLVTHEGVPMGRLIGEVNKESENLHAEMLLRLLGRHAAGEGTVERGHEAVERFLEGLGAPHEGWGLRDGSGLSRANIVTPRGLAALLVAMDRHPQAAVFRGSLAVAGVDGTLEERMRGTPAEGRVVGKTGSLRRVDGLAGYVTTVRDDRLAFVVLVNNQVDLSGEARAAIDDVASALATAR